MNKIKARTMQNVINDNDYIYLSQKLSTQNNNWKNRINTQISKMSPLTRAIKNNAWECFDILMQHKANVNVDDVIRTALFDLCTNNASRYFDEIYKQPNLDIELCFYELGNVKYRGMEGIAFDKLLKHPNRVKANINITTIAEYITKHKDEFIYILLDPTHGMKIDPYIFNEGLALSITKNKYNLISYFIDNGADINKIIYINTDFKYKWDIHDYYPLELACMAKNIKSLKILIDKGADCNIIFKNNCTPLMLLTHYFSQTFDAHKCDNIMKIIINTNTNINYINSDNIGAIHIAIRLNSTAMVKYLLDKGATLRDSDIMYIMQIKDNPIYMVKLLCEHGQNLFYQDNNTCLLLEIIYKIGYYYPMYVTNLMYNLEQLFNYFADKLSLFPLQERKKYLEHIYQLKVEVSDPSKPSIFCPITKKYFTGHKTEFVDNTMIYLLDYINDNSMYYSNVPYLNKFNSKLKQLLA